MICVGIPIRNQMNLAKRLLYSLDKYTNENLIKHLIIIDDGSRPSIKDADLNFKIFENIKKTIIRNEEPKGFPKACNNIIEMSTSPYICIMNSDTFVSPNWLSYMLEVIKQERVGVVGPSTSYANDPQCRRDICGNRFKMSEDDIVNYSIKLSKSFHDPVIVGSVLTGFCMLLKREALNDVGLFDEQFGLGSFEEADLFKRMERAGWNCVWVPYAYVHHYGKQTFGGEKINWKELWSVNQKRFEKKWKEN